MSYRILLYIVLKERIDINLHIKEVGSAFSKSGAQNFLLFDTPIDAAGDFKLTLSANFAESTSLRRRGVMRGPIALILLFQLLSHALTLEFMFMLGWAPTTVISKELVHSIFTRFHLLELDLLSATVPTRTVWLVEPC